MSEPTQEEYEALLAERNNLRQKLAEDSQETERLRILIAGLLETLDSFSPEYPNAIRAMVHFDATNLNTPERRAATCAAWDEQLNNYVSTWRRFVHEVRTQSTV